MMRRDFADFPQPAGRYGWPWEPAGSQTPDAGDWPRVTIITPSYNQANFLEATIRSVLLQDYPNLEYLVVDGGSQDGSAAIIEKYAPWLDYWVSEADRGQSQAINKGLAHASGDIVAWLNSDDAYLPGAVLNAVRALQAEPGAVLVHGNCVYIDDAGAIIRDSRGQIEPEPGLERLLTRGAILLQPSVFMRRSALTEAGFLDESLFYCLDYDLWLRLRRQGPFVFLAEPPLALFRLQERAKTFNLPLALAGEMYQVAARGGGDGLGVALRPLRMRWHSLLQTAAGPAQLRQDLASAAARGWAPRLRRAARHLAAQLLADTAFAMAQRQPGPAAQRVRAAVRYRPAFLTNRGIWSILWRGRGGFSGKSEPT